VIMENKCWPSFAVLILLLGIASAVKYRFEIENEEIFTPCAHQPSNVKDITEFIDFSEFQTHTVGKKMRVSGNLTSKWNYDPTDYIEGTGKVLRFERREWVNTMLSVSFNHICSDLFDKEKHWYKFWTKHLINEEEAKLNCFLNGTRFIHEPFELDITIDVPVVLPIGVHKLVVIFKAVNKNRQVREPILCFEIMGESFKS
ncbi:hypothetical protein KR044_005487, partial [Drosophila immigrans]